MLRCKKFIPTQIKVFDHSWSFKNGTKPGLPANRPVRHLRWENGTRKKIGDAYHRSSMTSSKPTRGSNAVTSKALVQWIVAPRLTLAPRRPCARGSAGS